jgi:hypothetical protein
LVGSNGMKIKIIDKNPIKTYLIQFLFHSILSHPHNACKNYSQSLTELPIVHKSPLAFP